MGEEYIAVVSHSEEYTKNKIMNNSSKLWHPVSSKEKACRVLSGTNQTIILHFRFSLNKNLF